MDPCYLAKDWFATHDWSNPAENAEKAAEILKDNLARSNGNRAEALYIYNSGNKYGTGGEVTLWRDVGRRDYYTSVKMHIDVLHKWAGH